MNTENETVVSAEMTQEDAQKLCDGLLGFNAEPKGEAQGDPSSFERGRIVTTEYASREFVLAKRAGKPFFDHRCVMCGEVGARISYLVVKREGVEVHLHFHRRCGSTKAGSFYERKVSK